MKYLYTAMMNTFPLLEVAPLIFLCDWIVKPRKFFVILLNTASKPQIGRTALVHYFLAI